MLTLPLLSLFGTQFESWLCCLVCWVGVCGSFFAYKGTREAELRNSYHIYNPPKPSFGKEGLWQVFHLRYPRAGGDVLRESNKKGYQYWVPLIW